MRCATNVCSRLSIQRDGKTAPTTYAAATAGPDRQVRPSDVYPGPCVRTEIEPTYYMDEPTGDLAVVGWPVNGELSRYGKTTFDWFAVEFDSDRHGTGRSRGPFDGSRHDSRECPRLFGTLRSGTAGKPLCNRADGTRL